MPRKVEPTAVTVLAYFETAPIDAAELVWQLAKAVIAKRRGVKPAARQRKSVPAASLTPHAESGAAPPPIPMPDPKGPPTPASTAKPRSRRMRAAPSSQEIGQQDVPLPGLPGPVPVVGG